jgi:hypothetical protein
MTINFWGQRVCEGEVRSRRDMRSPRLWFWQTLINSSSMAVVELVGKELNDAMASVHLQETLA